MTALNSLFDESFYLAAYPDVAAAVRNRQQVSGLQHFLNSGMREGRTAISRFYSQPDRELAYRQAYPDVDAAIRSGGLASGLQHYFQSGESEGRSLFPRAFDEQWYRKRFSDVNNAITQKTFTSGLEHYVRFGRGEQRAPSTFFDFDYFQAYPDVKAARDNGAAFLSGWDHFNQAGRIEGRVATFSGTKGNDLVVGNGALDTLTGVEMDAGRCFAGGTLTGGQCREYLSLGANELDTLTGGPGVDSFEVGRQLTTRFGINYSPFYTAAGNSDFVRIQNFEPGKDRLILGTKQGDPGFRASGTEFVSAPDGVYVYARSQFLTGGADLMAIVAGVDLDASDVLVSTTFLGS